MGSALVGRSDLIDKARRWRKMVGGGLRQIGIVAAAAIHALDHHFDRMADDHRRAKTIAEELNTIDGFRVNTDTVQSNMVFVTTTHDQTAWQQHCAEKGIQIRTGAKTRLVTHLDIDDKAVQSLISTTREFAKG